jgi:hypothetical protein
VAPYYCERATNPNSSGAARVGFSGRLSGLQGNRILIVLARRADTTRFARMLNPADGDFIVKGVEHC